MSYLRHVWADQQTQQHPPNLTKKTEYLYSEYRFVSITRYTFFTPLQLQRKKKSFSNTQDSSERTPIESVIIMQQCYEHPAEELVVPRFKRMKPRVGIQYQTKVAKAPVVSLSDKYESTRPVPSLLSTEYAHLTEHEVKEYQDGHKGEL